MLYQPRGRSVLPLTVLVLLVCFTFYHLGGPQPFLVTDVSAPKGTPQQVAGSLAPYPEEPNCTRFAPADMLVIIKTGATEIQRKLPIHFSTTLRCIPHFVIFSDMAEEIGEHRVHDVLSSVSENTKANNKDFLLYRKLQELQASGGTALNPNDTSYEEAWTLDKWKFLPMMGEALRARPDAKWFYFIETDTAVLWDNLFTYLSRFDPSEPLYIGCQTFIGDVWFAHGGTGWIMSEPAVRLVAEKWQNEQAGMEKLVSEQWAGDAVLALVLKDMGIGITTSWPILQGETPHSLDYTPHHWCYPVASYHHVDEKWIQAIYDFQEEWVAGGNDQQPIRHRDAFERFVQPHLRHERERWDNVCNGDRIIAASNAEDCRKSCQESDECVQWIHTPGKCKTDRIIRLGSSIEHLEDSVETVSGWMLERVADFKKRHSACDGKDYWVP